MTIKILIADDHNLVVEAVSATLNSNADRETITTDSLSGALELLAIHRDFNVVLLDLNMPGMAGLQSVSKVIKASGDAKVLLFTGSVNPFFLESALKMGCKGVVLKKMPLKSLDGVIQLVLSGQIFVPIDIPQVDDKDISSEAALTSKELYVLKLASDGLTNAEIAASMNTSDGTVKMHMRSICKKLGARNRAHAAIISRERSLI